MEQEFYEEGAAKVICKLTGYDDGLEIRGDGVYVKSEYLDEDLNQQVFTWVPACEMDWPGAPDPLTAPALPIRFTARNLAAFMLDGAGQGIQSTFGHIELAPDEDELSSLDMRATKVRKALREAYALAQQAQRVVGTDNHDEQDRAADLLSAYRVLRSEAMVREKVMESVITREEYFLRLARANEPLAAQKAEAQKAKAEADTRHREWLKAMVHQLLNPALSAALCATPAPVVADKRRKKKPSIESVAFDYMRNEYQSAQFQSAAKFHKHLIKTAGLEKSPFEMGTGTNARKLFCPAASSFFEEGTLSKIWAKIRAV